ncbi:hypothetical protein [Velocimicrobium porci]|uniref:Uncharacterized protein n=1 Tax=Velocimicrobium porci TaxID=2606634 RepID=A0A6L5Y2L2_9FIRM|nr:hypothetical protein [Velocimicrobium porci]MSS64598.1 hypothetical protein [Velocimicrobium porci]
MKYPCLVPKQFCTTPIHVSIESEEINNLGMPKYVLELDIQCNYQETAKPVLTAEKKIIQINGIALFCGDIAPNIPILSSGTVIINGIERQIVTGEKARNPDGTVNYCRLNLV